ETLLVTGTAREWCQRRTGTNEERPDALRGMELVADQRQEVHAQVIHANGDLPDRLSGVAVDERPGRVRRLRDVGDRLHDAPLPVPVHDRDEARVRAPHRPRGGRWRGAGPRPAPPATRTPRRSRDARSWT